MSSPRGTASGSRWTDGSEAVEFVSCSYLGLESHPDLIAAATEALRRFGLHFSTSRNRGRPPYLGELEDAPVRHVRRRAGGRLHLGQQRPSGLAAAARRRRPAQLSRGRRRRRVPRREDGARLHPGDPRRARADRADAALRHDRSRSAARSGPRGRGHRSDAGRAGRRRRLDGRPDRRGFDAGHHSSRSVATCTWTTPTGSRSTARSAPVTRSKRSGDASSACRARRLAVEGLRRRRRFRGRAEPTKTCGSCASSPTPWCSGTRSCFPCSRRTSPQPGCMSTARWPSCNGGSGATPPSSTG